MVRIRDRARERQRNKERLAAMSPEERERRLEKRREKDRRRRLAISEYTKGITKLRPKAVAPVVPDDVLQEAARAAAAPRSLTASLMGDPPVGRRALDAKAHELGMKAVSTALAAELANGAP